jgi:FkbM family methyltransferase
MNNQEYYGKFGEDLFVLNELNYKKNGFFIDIGAHNGISNSNTYLLEKEYAWNGICVEANPLERSFQALKKNRTCICENLAIFDYDGIIQFQARGRHPELSGVIFNESSEEIKIKNNNGHPITNIRCVTLLNLLNKNKCPKIIDFMSLDTEGSEFIILKNFDFNLYCFKVIIVEHNVGSPRENYTICKNKKDNIYNLLIRNGYILKHTNMYDDYYVYRF